MRPAVCGGSRAPDQADGVGGFWERLLAVTDDRGELEPPREVQPDRRVRRWRDCSAVHGWAVCLGWCLWVYSAIVVGGRHG